MCARRVPLEKPPTKAELAKLDQQQKAWRAVVGANLRKARTDAGLSQHQLAIRADVSGNYLGQVELGRRGATIDFLARVASALGISPADFLIQS
jgi:ribosome-binding protein aMBF1 (putative translation factor)